MSFGDIFFDVLVDKTELPCGAVSKRAVCVFVLAFVCIGKLNAGLWAYGAVDSVNTQLCEQI